MTTRIVASAQINGVGCEVVIEHETATGALAEFKSLLGGTEAPKQEAASQTTPVQTAPAATQTAPPTPSGAATAPAPDAGSSATETNTPPKVGGSAPAAESKPDTAKEVLEAAKALLSREGGEAYLTWALGQVGASTVGTTPPEKHADLLAHINNGLNG